MNRNKNPKDPKDPFEVKKFGLHALINTIAFMIVAVSAVAISLFTHWLESHGIDHNLIMGLKAVEYSVFAIDAVAYVSWVVSHLIKNLKEK
jgi:hypothetical protein